MENYNVIMDELTDAFRLVQKRIDKEFINKENDIKQLIIDNEHEMCNFIDKQTCSKYALRSFDQYPNIGVESDVTMPNIVCVGKLCGNFPFLYPFTDAFATSFLKSSYISVNNNDVDIVDQYITSVALRFMCACQPEKSKFYIIDNAFGQSLSIVNSINVEKVNYQRIQTTEITSLLLDLSNIVTDHNMFPNEDIEIQHFVFLSDFPEGMSLENIERLKMLINNRNATNAGVYFFLSYNDKVLDSYNNSILEIIKFTTCLNFPQQDDFLFKLFSPKDIYIEIINSETFPFILDVINKRSIEKNQTSIECMYSERIRDNHIWESTTIDAINIPIGCFGKRIQYLTFGESADYSGLIGGLPGRGKTVLLHNIILWGACKYSPKELKYCLIDLKNGTGLNLYRKLPHTLVQSTSNNSKFCLSVLEKLVDEMKSRAELFKQAANEFGEMVDKLQTYRKVTCKVMPRILVIIDEFQVLFEEVRLGAKIAKFLDKIIREGRAFGVHLLLCSQGIGKADIPQDIFKNVTWRLSFELSSEDEARRIIGNSAPLQLSKPGDAVLNNKNGDSSKNINLQIGFIDNPNTWVNILNDYAEKKYDIETFEKWGDSDGTTWGKIQNNKSLANAIITDTFKINDRFCDLYIGEPDAIRDRHNFIRIRKQTASNVLILGSNFKLLVQIIGLSLYQLRKQSGKRSFYYIVNAFNVDSEYADVFEFMSDDNTKVLLPRKLNDVLDIIDIELSNRQEASNKDEVVSGRVVLFMPYVQNCRALRKDGYKDSPAMEKLKRIIKDGPEYGIHVFVHVLNAQSYNDFFQGLTSEFENRIALDNNLKNIQCLFSSEFGLQVTDGSVILQNGEDLSEVNPDITRVYGEFFNKASIHKDDSFLEKLFNIK